MTSRPNLLYVFGDQWRAQAAGYAGDPNVRTPRVDAFAREGLSLPHLISGIPVCSPYRACLLTGQYPLTHGMLVNDQSIRSRHVSLARAYRDAGYHTGWIGKWHLDGNGREAFVPPARRMDFDLWLGYECCHGYLDSHYWDEAGGKHRWEGYDAAAQTAAACQYLRDHAGTAQPWSLFLSWGPPHNPYQTAPERYRALYDPARLVLPPNVPPEAADRARTDLAGYYAHCTALDELFGQLLDTLAATGQERDTIVVFTSDHGDMHGAHGLWKKQHPHDESVRVPFLLRWPAGLGTTGRVDPVVVNSPDLMPTLLGLCGVPIPETVEGVDFSPHLRGERVLDDGGAYLACYRPFHEVRYDSGGRDYRGLRTQRYTYCRDHHCPWLLFDNWRDPHQQHNLAGDAASAALVQQLDAQLQRKLDRLHDRFATGDELAREYDIVLNDRHDVATGRHAAARVECRPPA
jgi:arylsulfatase A-like enzyme